MTDDELLEQFEAVSIPGDCFHHAEHVRVAFVYLCRYPLLEALGKFSTSLKRFAAANGKPERYHETITWGYLFLVHERIGQESWEMFARGNPDLLDWERPILKKYYREETLASASARSRFVMPDRLAESAVVNAEVLRLT
jgi:hypothetical protein